MKRIKICLLCLAFGMLGTPLLLAQNTTLAVNDEPIEVQKYTVLEKFAPELVVPVEDRVQLKEERIVELRRTKELLDTADISDRKRRKLMRDLRRSPLPTQRLNKVIAETKLEDDDGIEQ